MQVMNPTGTVGRLEEEEEKDRLDETIACR